VDGLQSLDDATDGSEPSADEVEVDPLEVAPDSAGELAPDVGPDADAMACSDSAPTPHDLGCKTLGACTAGAAVTCMASLWACDYSLIPCYGSDDDCDCVDNDCDGVTDPLCEWEWEACQDDPCDHDGDGIPNAGMRCGGQACPSCGGLGDFPCDNCWYTPNPDQSDIDLDGLGDACDCDIDGDGLPNNGGASTGAGCPHCGDLGEPACDNCPFAPNPNQEDTNGDGIGDSCEDYLPCDTMPCSEDNCPWVRNPDQSDIDLDSVGDACDCDIDGDEEPNNNPGCPVCCNARMDFSPSCTLSYDGDQVICCQADPYPECDCAPYSPSGGPAAGEVCNGYDDDCNGMTDEGSNICPGGQICMGKAGCVQS
jgi:hypothetical protein